MFDFENNRFEPGAANDMSKVSLHAQISTDFAKIILAVALGCLQEPVLKLGGAAFQTMQAMPLRIVGGRGIVLLLMF
jgi:hypothetical protein